LAALPHQHIQSLIQCPAPLVTGYRDLNAQLQPNGMDLTLEAVSEFLGAGRLGLTPEERRLPDAKELGFDDQGFIHLAPGPYLITLNETIHLPTNLMALAKPRSSLLRSGVTLHSAVWDAGYHGRSQALITVYNSYGFTVARNARVLQLVFVSLASATASAYAGRYQGENLSPA